MSRNTEDVEDSAAEIELDLFVGPRREPEVCRHVRQRRPDHDRVGSVGELRVPGAVVTVRVGVRHDELVALTGVGTQPLLDHLVDGLPHREPGRVGGGPGVQEKGAKVAEQQIQERPLEARPFALA